jgi:hypothetical protein
VIGLGSVSHPQTERGNDGFVGRVQGMRQARSMGIDDHIHVALAVEQDLARAVSGHGTPAHHLEHLPKRLGLGSGVLNEFNP